MILFSSSEYNGNLMPMPRSQNLGKPHKYQIVQVSAFAVCLMTFIPFQGHFQPNIFWKSCINSFINFLSSQLLKII